MENLGKAVSYVEIFDGLPNISPKPIKNNFDIGAYNWKTICTSEYLQPLLTENVSEPNSGFFVCFPSRRKLFIDNYITKSDGSSGGSSNGGLPYITWTPQLDITSSYVKALTAASDNGPAWDYNTVGLTQPDQYTDPTYQGPMWYDSPQTKKNIPPSDIKTLGSWAAYVTSLGMTALPSPRETPNVSSTTTPSINYVNQAKCRDGLLWCIESSDFLSTNMPFWIHVLRTQPPPLTKNHKTFMVISLGISGTSDNFDLYLPDGDKPQLIDYNTGGQVPFANVEFSSELSKISGDQKGLDIGFMTAAGRLIIFINKTALVYTRINRNAANPDDKSGIIPAVIGSGKIRIYGSNVQACINVSPMTFAPLSVMAFSLPIVRDIDGQTGDIAMYKGVKNNNSPSGSTAELPTDPTQNQILYGVDCGVFTDKSGTSHPSGFGFHEEGYGMFVEGKKTVLQSDEPGLFVMIMEPSDVSTSKLGTAKKYVITNGGCPYFYFLKGQHTNVGAPPAGSIGKIYDVIALKENTQAADMFHIERTATVTLYNPNGIYDYFKSAQRGIRIYMGWNGDAKLIFTGITIGANTSEIAGKETIDLQCVDYTYVLKETPIMNSPYYDGMIDFYVVKDLAQRVGIQNLYSNIDFINQDLYFMPSGYSMTAPAVKFPSMQKIYDCVMQVVQKDECYIYFDVYGQMHMNKLPGGLWGSVSSLSSPVAAFTRDPTADPSTIILDEKNVEYSTDSTVNVISIMSISRDTMDPFFTEISTNSQVVLFKKVYMLDQGAFADINTAKVWMTEASERMFYPTRKISFKTVGLLPSGGGSDNGTLLPYDFFTVDDEEFRLMAYTKSYNADENSLTNEYNAEWLYGK